MFFGFSMMMQFVETIAKVIPFLSKVIGAWTGIIAFCLTLVLWFVVIWLAWIAVRPVVWISCLVIAAAWIFLLSKSKKNKKESDPEIQQPNTTESLQA
jgi:ABC-type bacteriocin/lantibiotic exporter with double-glycine peptidase domain